MTFPGIAVEALSFGIGSFRLDEISFTLSGGETLVVLGPNGSGKSVTLELIAGFHRPDAGRVLIGGRDVTALPPEGRNVGFVVQNFGLFPHLTVTQNIEIGMRRGKTRLREKPSLDASSTALLGHFGIAKLGTRMPHALSPGEKQRVALARALAAQPDVFLFDEPFSALDTATRDVLRTELLSFLRELAIPAIFVTHDHRDALTPADQIVVLRDGRIVQTGASKTIFDKPINAFVADFVGVENILAATVAVAAEGFVELTVAEHTLKAETSATLHIGRNVQTAIRAENVVISLRDPSAAWKNNQLAGCVTDIQVLGPLATVFIDCGFRLKAYLLAREARALELAVGTPVAAEIAPDDIHVMVE